MNLVFIIRSGKNLSQTLASIKFTQYGENTNLPYIICQEWNKGFLEAKRSYRYGIFVDSGTVFYDVEKFLLALLNYPHQGLVGHIVDPKDDNEYYWLHPQCFLLELEYFHTDNFACAENQSAVVPIRSKKNIHDDYTPLWLRQTNDIKNYTNFKFGGLLINEILKRKKIAVNFSVTIRETKKFLYDIRNDLDWLASNQEYLNMATNQLWILNNEYFSLDFKHKKVICPGSGFYWMQAAQLVDEVEIVDISQIQIKFVQELLDNWNGNDYGGFVIDFMQTNGVLHYNLNKDLTKLDRIKFAKKDLLRKYINEHAIKINWQLVKTKKINLYNQNIVSFVLNKKPTTADIWMSNILDYKYTLLNTSYEDIEQIRGYMS